MYYWLYYQIYCQLRTLRLLHLIYPDYRDISLRNKNLFKVNSAHKELSSYFNSLQQKMQYKLDFKLNLAEKKYLEIIFHPEMTETNQLQKRPDLKHYQIQIFRW
jgi:hypothetical protein